jgi:hypothetical protein
MRVPRRDATRSNRISQARLAQPSRRCLLLAACLVTSAATSGASTTSPTHPHRPVPPPAETTDSKPLTVPAQVSSTQVLPSQVAPARRLRLARWLILKIAKDFLGFLAVPLLGWLVWREMRRSPVIFDPFAVPKKFEEETSATLVLRCKRSWRLYYPICGNGRQAKRRACIYRCWTAARVGSEFLQPSRRMR